MTERAREKREREKRRPDDTFFSWDTELLFWKQLRPWVCWVGGWVGGGAGPVMQASRTVCRQAGWWQAGGWGGVCGSCGVLASVSPQRGQ